jgi:hypothetical protein
MNIISISISGRITGNLKYDSGRQFKLQIHHYTYNNNSFSNTIPLDNNSDFFYWFAVEPNQLLLRPLIG